MARWRDVRHGKVELKEKTNKSQEEICLCDAPLMPRIKAFITDMFMLLMPIMYLVFYVVMGSREEFAQDKMHGWLYIIIPNMIAVVSFWYFKAQTPGMKAYEISIIDSKTAQKPIVIKLFARYFFTFIAIFIPILWLIPYFNKKKKTFQDYLSGTCIKTTSNE